MIPRDCVLRDWVRHNRIINWCWQFSSGHSENTEKPIDTLALYVKNGFTVFDGADIYTWVEEIFWELNSRYPELDQLRFHTKHVPDLQDVVEWKITKDRTIKQIMRSCQRMKIQKLSNVQFHWWDYESKGYDISLNTLSNLQKEWVIEHVGITNTNVDFLMRLENELNFTPMTTQNQYSILDRRPEKHLIPHIQDRDIWLYCYGSIMWWLLTDRYLWVARPEEPLENRSLRKYLRVIDDWWNWKMFQELLNVLSTIWKRQGVTIAQIAMSWVLNQQWVSSVILWVRNSKYIQDLDVIFNIDLTDSDLEAIDKIYFRWQELEWDVFDLERDEPRHRDIMKFNLNKEDKRN